MTRDTALSLSVDAFDTGTFWQALADLVRIPSESQNPDAAPHLATYLSDQIIPRAERLGMTCSLLPNPMGGAPFLLAQRIEDPALPTILSYGHGDVTRAQSADWDDGLTPFELTHRGDRVYGRGTADNKGQHLINLTALESVITTRGHLGFNLKLLMEMGEEIGSPGLADLCETEQDRLKADVLIASDGPRLDPDTPTLFMGARGALNFDLSIDLRPGAHHSGNWGGLLADPAMILSHALATITDARGAIQIPEWRPHTLTQTIRNVLADLPEPKGADPDWGEPDLSAAERVFGWNAFSILALHAGIPEAPVNAIAGQARATCQLRFVVGTQSQDILPALRRHLDRNGFERVTITETDGDPFEATRLDPAHPWAQFAITSITRTVGRKPHVLPNLGGSLPNACFAETLGLPTIWVPHSYTGCNQHAPNEHVLEQTFRQAAQVMTGLFWDIAEHPPTK
ncbi:M20 peptidase family dipeptidase [Phaeobacter gallaeciensis]|uniref:M20 peptidase family dipeptidase n=2 Tax=Roseobacteraceae TaxID=2854170 RepID=A0A366WUE7_9RHOB|nr:MULTISPECIES: M20 family metallopeptidase [Roseobacteraceae]MBT3140768.1 M20 family metallopeptidase [Falsiruegeria litorea]MBT8170512.1 M20 family metallopeptidase [Falsiruegeria litorea]RBW52953.1 M20 peptidase family dipeptidase [Phaeobacter gallaeciensis]